MDFRIDVITDKVWSLILKAANADKADDALKFSQAAQNAANAMGCVDLIRRNMKDDKDSK
jgi:hypothetical protein